MWRTGHRLGEVVKTSSELTYFVRSDVTFRIKGVLMADPSADELEHMTDGDVVYLEAFRSKNRLRGHRVLPHSVRPALPLRANH
eukprot:2393300-Pleurochrysis_carterae.AAC.1